MVRTSQRRSEGVGSGDYRLRPALENVGGQGSMTPRFHDLVPKIHLRAVNLTAQVLTK